ncbi:hypothetical protein ES703_36390 [subsurface metagenome]
MGRRIIKALSIPVMLILLLLFSSSCDTTLREQIELFVDSYNAIIKDGIIYVSVIDGSDENPGTLDHPKKTIQSGIDLADELMDSAEVRVAEGTYNINKTLMIKEGISIKGGYSAIDWMRDTAQHETIIKASDIDTAVKILEGVTVTTAIEGFTIKAAWENTVTAVYCDGGSPTIRNNTIDASLGIQDSVGIFNKYASPVIVANTINAGKGIESCWGIVNVNSSPRIWNNIIYSEGSSNFYKGIVNTNSSASIIQNNTIDGGPLPDAVMIYNSSSRPVIENNILFTLGNAYGIHEEDSSALPVKLNNNDFYGCNPIYDYDGGTCTTINEMENYLFDKSVSASENVSDYPKFVYQAESDYHLKIDSPLKESGLDLSNSFTTDRDGATRTDPLSIGAYEYE